MKSKPNILFELILNLSKKEKIEFIKKLEFKNLQDLRDMFLEVNKLFDTEVGIEKIEDSLKKNLSSRLIKYYRINKSNLKKELISFISEQNNSCDIKCMLRNSINEGATLIKLRYFEEGLKLINTTKQKAIKEESFEVVIYALENIRNFDFSYRKNHKLAFKLNQELLHYHKLMNNLNELVSLSFYIYSFQNDLSIEEDKIYEIINYDILKSESNALSLKAKKFFYLSWLDIYNFLKDYDKMYQVLREAIIYAKNAYAENEKYCLSLLLMYERLEFTLYNLKRYDEALETITIIENFKPPNIYANNAFVIKLKTLDIKLKKLLIYATTNNKLLKPYCFTIITLIKKTKMDPNDKLNFYYSAFFTLTTNLKDFKETSILFKRFFKFFIKNIDSFNPNNTQVIQIFLCYYVSAYKLYNLDSFIFVNETLFKKKYDYLFKTKEAEFYYVSKLYNIFLKSYEEGFFNIGILEEYYSIWGKFPSFFPRASCIPKKALSDEYNNKQFEKITAKYEKVSFEC